MLYLHRYPSRLHTYKRHHQVCYCYVHTLDTSRHHIQLKYCHKNRRPWHLNHQHHRNRGCICTSPLRGMHWNQHTRFIGYHQVLLNLNKLHSTENIQFFHSSRNYRTVNYKLTNLQWQELLVLVRHFHHHRRDKEGVMHKLINFNHKKDSSLPQCSLNCY